MKIIINESQLRLIVENQGENLMDLSIYTDIDPSKWDSIFNRLNEKKGGKYDGYYIDGNVDIRNSPIKEFKHLVIIKGHLRGNRSGIENLGMLKKVNGEVYLTYTKNLKTLGNLKYVGFDLDLTNSNIEDLGYLNQVGRSLDLRFTPKLKSLGDVSPEFSEEKFKIYVTDFLMIYGTGLSDEEIKKIKYGWLSKSQYGN